MTQERLRRGATGEDAAVAYLLEHEWQIIERNCRLGRGEIDIVAFDRHALVFVEVKTRARPANSTFSPFDSVGIAKRRQLRELGGRWLSERGDELLNRPPREIRFDVIGVSGQFDQQTVEHIRDAF